MNFKIIVWLGLSILSGIFYRMGGSDKYNTKWRDIGCMLCAMLVLIFNGSLVYNVSMIIGLVLTAGLTFVSLTTYFKKKNTDAMWWNWTLVGLAWGLATLPFVFITQHWLGFILRTIFLGGSVTFWSQGIGDVKWEETGRGVLLTFTMPLLLI